MVMSYVICTTCGSYAYRHSYSECPNEWCSSHSDDEEEDKEDEKC